MSLLKPLEGMKNVLSTGGILKKLGSAAGILKFAKGIPLIGQILTAGFALVDSFSGWSNAKEILGKTSVSLADKAAAALGEAVNGLLLGIPDWIVRQFGGRNLSSVLATTKDGVSYFFQQTGTFTKNTFYALGKMIPGVSSILDIVTGKQIGRAHV